MSEIGDRLRIEREKTGLNQADFGAWGAVSRNTQYNYESGARKPDTGYLQKLAEHGVDVLYILTDQRIENVLNEEETRLLDRYRRTPPEKRHMLHELSEVLANHKPKTESSS